MKEPLIHKTLTALMIRHQDLLSLRNAEAKSSHVAKKKFIPVKRDLPSFARKL